MTKKEVCREYGVFAVYSMGLCGLNICHIEHGIDDFVYYVFVSGKKPTYHKSKVYYIEKGAYFNFYGRRVHLSECMRVGGF